MHWNWLLTLMGLVLGGCVGSCIGILMYRPRRKIAIRHSGNMLNVYISKENLRKDSRPLFWYNWAVFNLLADASAKLSSNDMHWLERRISDTCTQNIVADELQREGSDAL